MASISPKFTHLPPKITLINPKIHPFSPTVKPNNKVHIFFHPNPTNVPPFHPQNHHCRSGLNPCFAVKNLELSATYDDDDEEGEGIDGKLESGGDGGVVVVSATEQTKSRRRVVRVAWEKLVRWSRSLRSRKNTDVLQRTKKVVVLGGGSFGTAMAAHVAGRKAEMEVNMLVRDPQVCKSINESNCNSKYFPNHKLPQNLRATTDAKFALQGADFCLHAVPVQFTASFLESIVDYVDPSLPFISLSKGLELNTLRMMSQIIPQTLKNPRQPFVALSGPSFALEIMNKLPTAMVVASRDKKLANEVQQFLASDRLRINTSNAFNVEATSFSSQLS